MAGKTGTITEEGAGTIAVTVCYATAEAVWQQEVRLPEGATLAQAIAASGFADVFPDIDPEQSGTGVYGQKRPLDHVLHALDRVEIYRPLTFDPMASRRRRVAHKSTHKRSTKLSKANR